MKQVVSIVMLCLSLAVPVWAGGETVVVEALVKDTVDAVFVVARDTQAGRAEKLNRVMAILTPVFDLPLMAKLTLGRTHWSKFTTAQQAEFSELFLHILQNSYFDKLNLITRGRIEYDSPLREKKNRISLLARFYAKSEVFKIVYKLYKSRTGWKIYDVGLEGISMIHSYKAQYDQVLQSGSAADLIRKLRAKTKQLQAIKSSHRPVGKE